LLAAEQFARYVILMTGRNSISHLCFAVLLVGCDSIPQLDAAQTTAKQAGTYPAFLSASDLRTAVGSPLRSQPAIELARQAQLDQRAEALRRRDLTGE